MSLTQIEGIGQKKAKELLKHFRTLKAIKEASKEELLKVNGISEALADNIIEFYKKEN